MPSSASLLGTIAEYREAFAEYRLFYRALLQKRPIILRSLIIVPRREAELVFH